MSVTNLEPCTYCGLTADSVDHIPPRHMRRQLVELELAHVYEKEVPACRDCNSVLGSRPILTITGRRRYIKDQLRRRYRRYLSLPDRTDEEMQEFGYGLRGLILRSLAIRDLTISRLSWRGGRYGAPERQVPVLLEDVQAEPEVATILLKKMPVEKLGRTKPKSQKVERVKPLTPCQTCGNMFKKSMPWHLHCCKRCRLIAWIKAQVQE